MQTVVVTVAVVSPGRFRVEFSYLFLVGLVYLGYGCTQSPGDVVASVVEEVLEALVDHAGCKRSEWGVALCQLKQQALLEVVCSNAHWIHLLNLLYYLKHLILLDRVVLLESDVIGNGPSVVTQVSVAVERAHYILSDYLLSLIHVAGIDLLFHVFDERLAAGRCFLKYFLHLGRNAVSNLLDIGLPFGILFVHAFLESVVGFNFVLHDCLDILG